MIKTLLIDDEPLATKLLQEMLDSFPEFEVIGVCHDGFQGLKAIQEQKPDLIFLDIQMPKLNGFEMLELLENPPAVIFCTAFDAYAVQAFDKHAIDYLLKPYSKSRFEKAIEKFMKIQVQPGIAHILPELQEDKERIVVKVKNEIKILPIKEILFLEANDDFVNIYTPHGKFIKNRTLSHYEASLPAKDFVRIHRSYMLRVDQMAKLEPYSKDSFQVKLHSGQQLPVSKTGLLKLKALLGI